MKRFLPMTLVLVLLSSGCTIPGTGVTIPGIPSIPGLGGPTVVQYEHDILIIKSLEAVPAEIDTGQSAKIIAYIENVGDQPVGNGDVEVELYDYCDGLFTPKLLTCGSQQYSGALGSNNMCTIGKILPGEIVPVIWTVSQDTDDNKEVKVRTVCPPDGMKVLVRYPYSTSAVTTISLISLEEMQREIVERTHMPTESYIAIGQGPIKPYLTVEDKQPIPVFDTGEGARTLLKFQLKNMGSGQLDSKKNKVTVTQNVGGATTTEVIAIKGSQITFTGINTQNSLKPMLEDNGCKIMSDVWRDEPVQFVGRETSPYNCKVSLSEGQIGKTTTRHIQVEVEDYYYVVTKNVLLTVDPKIIG